MAKKRGKPRFFCVQFFYRAAIHRFEEARFLLAESVYTTASVYLAGYSVECALKAVLLANTPPRQHEEVKDSFRGSRAHNFDWLREQLRLRHVRLPMAINRALAIVEWWSTDLRYEAKQILRKRAEAFLDASTVILEWAERSI